MAEHSEQFNYELYPYDISIDENGEGIFNALSIQASFYLSFRDILSLSQDEAHALVNTWKEERGQQSKKQPSQIVAEAISLEEREADLLKLWNYAMTLLQKEIGPLMQRTLDKMGDEILSRTLTDFSPQIAKYIVDDPQTRIEEVLKKRKGIRNAIRWQFNLPHPGRPRGRKTSLSAYNRIDRYSKLVAFIQDYSKSEGCSPTAKQAANEMGFGYPRKLLRFLKSYGVKQNWKAFVRDILRETK